MTIRRAALVFAFIGTAAAAYAPQPARTLSLPLLPLNLHFRALQPGDVILAELRADAFVKSGVIRFLGQTRALESAVPGARPFALFGIDLAALPRAYPFEFKSVRAGGRVEASVRTITVEPKAFSRQRLSVAEAMAVPPAAERERIRRESELVTDILNRISPDWLGDGPFQFPLPGREPYPNFGQQRIYNGKTASVHNGVDISAPWGEPARASNRGRVVLAGRLYFSGNTVIIDHGRGVFTFYGHFSKLTVKRGEIVRKGQVIGRVGATGRSTGPHVHWSARIGNARVDPCALLGLPL